MSADGTEAGTSNTPMCLHCETVPLGKHDGDYCDACWVEAANAPKAARVLGPREQWEVWQREGRPTLGAHKPLVDYLYSHAEWHAAGAFVAEARGQSIDENDVEQLRLTVVDLVALLREAGAL
jgi:hypothetical protein